MKPVATGFDPREPPSERPRHAAHRAGPPSDAGGDRRASRPGALPRRCRPTWRRVTNTAAIDFDALVGFCRSRCGARRTLLIEASVASWCRSTASRTVLDWMAALQIPVVLVTGSYLGSHQPYADRLDVLARRGLVVKSIIVNDTPGSTVTMQNASDTVWPISRVRFPIVGLRRLPPGPAETGFSRISRGCWRASPDRIAR